LRRNYLKIVYLAVGLASLVFFAWTGRYLLAAYPQKEELEMGFRVMLRSRHIFLLLMALAEIGIGVYIRTSRKKFFLAFQLAATALIIAAHSLFIAGFFYEVAVETIPSTPLIHWATYLALGGVALHLVTIFEKKRNFE
jgi:hypothetical protein